MNMKARLEELELAVRHLQELLEGGCEEEEEEELEYEDLLNFGVKIDVPGSIGILADYN